MSERELCTKIESTIGNLFNLEFRKEHSVFDGVNFGISQSGPLLNAAIRAAKEGMDSGEKLGCSCCYEIYELLKAYKDIVNRTLEAGGEAELSRESSTLIRTITKARKAS